MGTTDDIADAIYLEIVSIKAISPRNSCLKQNLILLTSSSTLASSGMHEHPIQYALTPASRAAASAIWCKARISSSVWGNCSPVYATNTYDKSLSDWYCLMRLKVISIHSRGWIILTYSSTFMIEAGIPFSPRKQRYRGRSRRSATGFVSLSRKPRVDSFSSILRATLG